MESCTGESRMMSRSSNVPLSRFGYLTFVWLVIVMVLLSTAALFNEQMSLRLTGALFLLLFLLAIIARIGRRRATLQMRGPRGD